MNNAPLRIVALGGLGEIGINCMAYECGDDLILVDAGLMFPDADMPGVDYVIPDFSWLRERADKLRGILLTHGHEDHIGALPFLLREFPAPIYGTSLTLGILEGKLLEYELRAGLPQGVSFQDQVPINDQQRRVQITLNIISDKFEFIRPGTEDGYFFSGDLVTTIEADAIDLITGGFVNVTDFLGKTLAVRIPAGFDPRTRLKVAKHGYSNWNGDKADGRGDLYIRIVPKFAPLKDVPMDKRTKLYDEIKSLMPAEESK
jgi:hypothetical protein